jgi:putative membrane protein
MNMTVVGGYVVNALLFAFLGIFIFVVAFLILDKLTPYDLWKEVCEQKNVALAIMLGLMSLGLCVIIAAAVH